jgi:predicted ribosomally synthesized peptide with nif11-like leader
MPTKDVKSFFEKVEEDRSLQEKLQAIVEKRKAQDAVTMNEMCKLAETVGFNFTPAEVAEVRNSHEFTDDQLRAALGDAEPCACGPWFGC